MREGKLSLPKVCRPKERLEDLVSLMHLAMGQMREPAFQPRKRRLRIAKNFVSLVSGIGLQNELVELLTPGATLFAPALGEPEHNKQNY